MESSTPTYNKTIDVLKCFLCFGIVLYHTNFSPSVLTEKVAFFDEWRHIFIYTVLDVCVPLFFVISGYLYFNRVNQLTYSLYKAKTISRVRTLLLPYLIANIIFLLLRIIVNPDLDLSFLNILNGITGYNGFPANYPLWFIRDLFIVCVLSPLFFFAAKRLPYVVLIVLLVCWFTNIWFDSFPQIASVRSFLFFYIGALLAIKRPQLRLTMLNKVVIGGGGYFVSVVLYVLTHNEYIVNLSVLLLMPLLYYLAIYVVHNIKVFPHSIVNCTYMIYLYHQFIVGIVASLFIAVLGVSYASLITSYFITPIIVCFILACVYFAIKKYMPWLCAVLLGEKR